MRRPRLRHRPIHSGSAGVSKEVRGRHPIYWEVKEFLLAYQVPQSRFGREALGDDQFYTDLEFGRWPMAKTVNKVRAYMQAHRDEVRMAAKCEACEYRKEA